MTATLAAAEQSKTHRWKHDENGATVVSRIHSSESGDGNDRSERECGDCGLVKITVHFPHGLPMRKWRTADGREWEGTATPPCLVREVKEVPVS